MTDEKETGHGAWSNVPVWDGSPMTWRAFRREMKWWVSSLDLAGTAKYNLAARWLLRQSGIVRQRGEEFDPDDLAHKPASYVTDPDTGEQLLDTPADYLFGLNKLLSALEGINGQTVLDQRGELRSQFYTELKRKAGERMSEYCTRFRTLVADLQSEGVVIPPTELGWFLKEKMGLDPLRKQLLETSLQGREEYEVIEAESLRLFKDLQTADPLFRKLDRDKPKLSIRRMFQGSTAPSSSSSSSTFSGFGRSSNFSGSSSVASRRAASSAPSLPTRKVYLTEVPEDEPELIPDEECGAADGDDGDAGGGESLTEILQTEAEAFATELQEAEQLGLDKETLDSLETGFEQTAEALVTMKEARSKLAEIRKDRGYGRIGSGSKGGGQPSARKSSGRHPCFDCGQHGHWAGDKECSQPGAGLARPKGGAVGKMRPKQVKLAEALNVSAVDQAPTVTFESSQLSTTPTTIPHEASMVMHVSSMSLDAALSASLTTASHSTLISNASQAMANDKLEVGALDSACNRTCAGPVWMESYMSKLHSEAPQHVQDLVMSVDEVENFRFGNGGMAPSSKRWRIPAVIGEQIILIWISLVPINSLGCLLGRDFLDAVGGILSFADRTLECSFLGTPRQRLDQMQAGHFILPLQPRQWPRLASGRWRKVGLDGIIELQLNPQDWLKRKLHEGSGGHPVLNHDHMLTESSLIAGRLASVPVEHEAHCVDAGGLAHSTMPSLVIGDQPPQLLLLPGGPQDLSQIDGDSAKRLDVAEVASLRAAPLGPTTMAFPRTRSLAVRSILLALLAFSISINFIYGSMGTSSSVYGGPSHFDFGPSSSRCPSWSIHCSESDRDEQVQRQVRLEDGFPGRFSSFWFLGPASQQGSEGQLESSGIGRSEDPSTEDRGQRSTRRRGSCVDWPPWWTSELASRHHQACSVASSGSGSSRYCASSSEEGSTYGGRPQEQDEVRLKGQFFEGNSNSTFGVHDATNAEASLTRSGRVHEVLTVNYLSDSGPGRPTSSRPSVPAGATIPGDAASSAAARDQHSGQRGSSTTTHRRSGSSREVGRRDEWSFNRPDPAEVSDGDIQPLTKIKPAVQQMVSQAWDRHRRDQLLISAGAREVNEVFNLTWEAEMSGFMQEALAVELQLPNPFVQEVFSDTDPVARAAQRRGLIPGETLTLNTGFDFRLESHRKKALDLIKKKKPYVVVLAFPCGPWSPLQRLNPAHDLSEKRAEGVILIRFAVEVALLQLRCGRHFLVENPVPSLGWKVPELDLLRQDPATLEVVVDMCRFGLKGPDGNLHRKGTRLLTSMQAVVSNLMDHRCVGGHVHSPVLGGSKITSAAGHYTPQFSDALIQAFMDQFDFESTYMLNPKDAHETNVAEHEVLMEESDVDDGRLGEEESDDSMKATEADKSLMIPPGIKNAVFRLHVNTGHRHPLRLARALVVCGAPPEAVVAAKMIKCSICQERRQPKSRAPASLPPPREVGQQLHIDLLIIEDALRRSYVVAHCTDNVSRFQAAQVLEDKSTASVIKFLQERWMPLLGRPSTIIADQGREFISSAFSDWCDSQSLYLHHIGVGAPWQNGVAERSGGTLKGLVGAIVHSQSISTFEEMQAAVSEATMAYNDDINEAGVAPIQLVTGKVPAVPGDVLNDFGRRLAEHSLIAASPSMAKQTAMRETARLAMVRLHYSRGFRKAALARSRSTTATEVPEAGDTVFFWRAQKYNSKKDVPPGTTRRRLSLKRWHGPGLMIAREGPQDGHASNIFISYRGQVTKCPVEHVRKASSLESVAVGAWEAAIDEVIKAARNDRIVDPAALGADVAVPHDNASDEEAAAQSGLDSGPGFLPSGPGLAVPGVGLSTREIAAAMQPAAQASPPASIGLPSRRDSLLSMPQAEPAGTAAPGTPVPELITQASQMMNRPGFQSTLARARSFDADGEADDRGQKRPAEQGVESLAQDDRETPFTHPASLDSAPAFEAMTMTWEQLCNVTENQSAHPLLQLQALVEMDRREPLDVMETDHGTWDGRWALLCERDWELQRQLGQSLPNGSHDVAAVQTARKEYQWSKMTPTQKKLWSEAAVQGWQAYVDNKAVQVLSMEEPAKVYKDLAKRGELDRILQPRFVLTDKHDGLRTESHPLPVKASSRLVVPGFRDRSNLEGILRRDAPTGSRLSQHFLFCVAAFHTAWNIISADVKAAFLKGDPYMDRELYLKNTNAATTPDIPLKAGQLCRVLKGIFGLADAPREWWLRLSRSMAEHGWVRSLVDAAMWCRWKTLPNGSCVLEGIVVAHVDDLLFTGSAEAEKSLMAIGDELGFGSLDRNDFTWCGKRIRRHTDGTIRLSMREYHQNLQEIVIPRHRKSDPDALLDQHEARQLRGVLGSLQWLVAQIRFDMCFGVSTLQGESPPTIKTLMRANALVREFKRDPHFELIFKPVDYRSAGIVAVSDAALGNVKLNGSNEGAVTEKVYSQACYFILLADQNLLSGKQGSFNIIDARSHRIPRVCRSTYGAETLAAEESMDVGQLCRGFLATIRGFKMDGRNVDPSLYSIQMTAVVDAKDVHDKGNSDTPSYGSMKSMAFSIAWMRSVLRKPQTCLKWTATDNMWIDGGTKDMDLTHMRRIMGNGSWAITFNPEFVKQVTKARSSKPMKQIACAVLPGERVSGDDPMLSHLMSLRKGWHFKNGIGL